MSSSLEQAELSTRFAKASADKWAAIDFELWDSGCPILPGCAANFECRTEHTYDGGDHVIFVGRVIRMRHDPRSSRCCSTRASIARSNGRCDGVTDP